VRRDRKSTLVLWDIDGTLLTIDGLGRLVYGTVLQRLTGVPLREVAEMAGRTERAIVRDTLAMHGIEADTVDLDEFFRAVATTIDELRAELPRMGRALPGAAEAIAVLAGEGAVQSLVTGNLRPVAVAKLRAYGLADQIDFAVGGYGDESADRTRLVSVALLRASEAYGEEMAGDQVVVIGDTPHDIRAAREAGVRSIGVATGRADVRELTDAQATVVLADLTDPEALVAAVFG
jgi:phosphoglycolate phosphatase